MNIRRITFYENGNMLVFGEDGEQIPELQTENLYAMYFDHLESLGINPLSIPLIRTVNAGGREIVLKPFKTPSGRWNFEITDKL